ncbi:bifunctional diaminohydroxyphosphoribosylaminopyrimidine deaminase/5-amino-6-(5-phosphoribosylamino)uracil reductase RibD [Luteimicrobium subarcticum]|uniref:Riboflavin biosynthesis protein RibD n=1 Tax=Luteimicrobium subarcticum TaxID=620910 RepID=A0A2M8W3U1_9MICO|nr:bifunctional diaminohydroxyphosphoribosylaminopyrimidine deaminase/5-amino-6-(5-phosphoribosylamino)uracil reductase RibD [Luteimicrobium subarcticum]PJI85594.1 diaminohydroxyphosphoribosylaminopyrimidine deaminase/5-amino-6-(5-phosphoribosylamino)uracil reductase [Luteimicrobium subarcticum]
MTTAAPPPDASRADPAAATLAAAFAPWFAPWFDRAVALAARGPAHGPNPRVGCVLLAPTDSRVSRDGTGSTPSRVVLAEGYHRGAGTPHAEADALARAREAGVDVRGATAVVTLEPCNHTGRTGPCSVALADAGVAEVVYAVADPNPTAAGGAAYLRSRGVPAALVPHGGAAELNHAWLASAASGRPYVILKLATTLDGRVAAADGTSRWITGAAAREHAHEVRARVDAIAVGTGTVAADDPSLTARRPDGSLTDHQPLRVVVGRRAVPPDAALHGPGGELVALPTHDVAEVLAALAGREVRTLVVEGGPRLAAAFLAAGVVDEVHHYAAPVLLGAGRSATEAFGVATLAGAPRFHPHQVMPLGDDVLTVVRAADPPTTPRPTRPAPAQEV